MPILNNFSYSITFKEIFPTESDFILFTNDYIHCDKNIAHTALTYKYLFNRFCNCNINYDTREAFFRQFSSTYENYYNSFKKQLELINLQYNYKASDLSKISTFINNEANNNNQETVAPLDNIITYVSTQNSGITKENEFFAYMRAIKNITSENLEEYLDKFSKHFYQVFGKQNIIYGGNYD